jgi:hypothetical protein
MMDLIRSRMPALTEARLIRRALKRGLPLASNVDKSRSVIHVRRRIMATCHPYGAHLNVCKPFKGRNGKVKIVKP